LRACSRSLSPVLPPTSSEGWSRVHPSHHAAAARRHAITDDTRVDASRAGAHLRRLDMHQARRVLGHLSGRRREYKDRR
jgi:hypothetical protein